jgi:hypothetical protein
LPTRHLTLTAVGGVAQERGFASKRPRPTLKGRHDPQAVASSGLRLQLLEAQPLAGDIVRLAH